VLRTKSSSLKLRMKLELIFGEKFTWRRAGGRISGTHLGGGAWGFILEQGIAVLTGKRKTAG